MKAKHLAEKKGRTTCYSLPELTGLHQIGGLLADQFQIVRASTTRRRERFWDTFDWRLYRHGYGLFSSRSRWTLCRIPDLSIAATAHCPATCRFSDDFADSGLTRELAAVIGVRALLQQATIKGTVTVARVLNSSGKTVARLEVGDRTWHGSEDCVARMRTLRLLPVRGCATERGAVSVMLNAASLPVQKLDRYTSILNAAGIEPAGGSSRKTIDLDRSMTANEAVRAILRHLLATIVANTAGVREDIDTEFLHDFRVAIRQTRSILSQLKPALPRRPLAVFKDRFSALAGMTNRLRDLDVYLHHEMPYRRQLPMALRNDIDPLFLHVRRQRLRAWRCVRHELMSTRYRTLIEDWRCFLQTAGEETCDDPAACGAIIPLARQQILKRFTKVVSRGRKLTGKSAEQEFHRLRIECKKLRYLLELFASLWPPATIDALEIPLKRLQNQTGRFQDLCIQQAELYESATQLPKRHGRHSRTLLAIGCLIGQLEQEKSSLRRTIGRALRDFDCAATGAKVAALGHNDEG